MAVSGITYELIRSRRRTVSVEITEEAKVVVRAPNRMPLHEIEGFVQTNADWILKHVDKAEKRNKRAKDRAPVSRNEILALTDLALAEFPDKVKHYAEILGVTYGKISVKHQKTLWGSCNRNGDLSFNCLLMKAPEHVRDYVIVHELCHRKEMNHSKAFWKCVEEVIPDYRECRKWQKEDGAMIMRAYGYM